jgi:hypothetical protein
MSVHYYILRYNKLASLRERKNGLTEDTTHWYQTRTSHSDSDLSERMGSGVRINMCMNTELSCAYESEDVAGPCT